MRVYIFKDIKYLFFIMFFSVNTCFSSESQNLILFINISNNLVDDSKSKKIAKNIVEEAISRSKFNIRENYHINHYSIIENEPSSVYFYDRLNSIPILLNEYVFLKKESFNKIIDQKNVTVILRNGVLPKDIFLNFDNEFNNFTHGESIDENINFLLSNENFLYLERFDLIEKYLNDDMYHVLVEHELESIFIPTYYLNSNFESYEILNEIENSIDLMKLDGTYYDIIINKHY